MRNVRALGILGMLATAVILAACAVGPDYRPPRVSSPDSFASVDAVQLSSDDVERDFWKSFGDEQLDALVEQALVANHDIRIAVARLREARALRGEAQLDLAPTLTTATGRTEARGSVRQVAPGASRDQDFYDASFDATWELDFFGRVRRGVESRSAQVQAAEADVYSTEVSITAEVARNYFELRDAQQRLEVARRNADNQRETLNITTARLDAGRGTELDTSRARAQLSATLATIPDLESAVTRNTLGLAVMVGRSPEALTSQLSQPRKLPALPVTQRIGTPELLLRRRPDIRSAERSLAAATAQIGGDGGSISAHHLRRQLGFQCGRSR